LVTANSVKDAFEKLKESLSTLMVDYLIPSIIVSPIVDIFPYREELDKEISRRPLEATDEIIETPTGKKVYSAPGSDFDENEEVDFDDDSELEDSFSDSEEE